MIRGGKAWSTRLKTSEEQRLALKAWQEYVHEYRKSSDEMTTEEIPRSLSFCGWMRTQSEATRWMRDNGPP